jgi:hypothetical protein
VTSLFLNGFSTTASFIGGGSIFLSLTITHFWYGLTRYPSVWNNFVSDGLVGSTTDENFAEIRDICSYYYDSQKETNSQMEAFLVTLPFTFIYHFNAYVLTLVYFVFVGGIQPERAGKRNAPSSITVSVFASNFMVVLLWFLGGKIGVVLSTATKIFNQNFYNALLFRRSFKDFALSFVFGNVLVIQDKDSSAARATAVASAFTVGASGIALAQVAHLRGLDAGSATEEKENNSQRTLTKSNKGKDKRGQSLSLSPDSTLRDTSFSDGLVDPSSPTGSAQDASSPTQAHNKREGADLPTGQTDNSIVASEEGGLVNDDGNVAANRESKLEGRDGSMRTSVIYEGSSSSRLKHIATIYSDNETSVRIDTYPSGMEKTAEQHSRDAPNFSKKTEISVSGKKDIDDSSTDFLNPSDVHIDLENHPGTIAWRNCISDAVEKFPIKAYTFRKHNWVMKKMQGRAFFVKENGNPRRKLNRSEIKMRSKIFHEKQNDLRKQIAGILTDLKDLKKNHNSSKSSSDHSRNSKKSTVPIEVDEKPLGILTKESSVDEEKKKREKLKGDAASAAKDSLVESSKESTISTLTQSNPPLPINPESRSTPWIQGPTEEARDVNTTGATENDSNHLRNSIYRILEYTSWLENLNPLREGDGTPLNKSRNQGEEAGDKGEGGAHTSPAEITADEVATGGIELVRDTPYWHSLVDDMPTQRRLGVPSSIRKRSDGVCNGKDPPKTIHWDVEKRHFIDTADVKSTDGRKLPPLWRRALHMKKGNARKGQYLSSDEPVEKHAEAVPTKARRRNGVSFWRKRRSIDVIIVDEEQQQQQTPEDFVPNRLKKEKSFEPIRYAKESRHEEADERVGIHRTGRDSTPKRNPRGKVGNINDDSRREAPVISPRSRPLSPYEQILTIIDKEYLEAWEGGDSCSQSGERSDPSEYPEDSRTGDLVKDGGGGKCCTMKNTMTCDDSFGFAGACAVRTASDDVGLNPLDDDVRDVGLPSETVGSF